MTNGQLLGGEILRPEETLVSPGGHGRLHYQNDGNLVVYLNGTPFWASHTAGFSAGQLKMQRDGNLVLSDAGGPIASTRTQGHAGAMVQLQDDGNFVLYENPHGPSAGTPIWASSTNNFVIGPVDPEPAPVYPLPAPISGRVEFIDTGRKGVRDVTGPRLITILHAGDLLARAKNHGWFGVNKALDYAQSRGYQAVRTWTNLPAPEWWGVPPRPGNFSDLDADHMTIIEQFSRELRSRKLRWLVSQGDLLWLYPDQPRASAYMTRLGRVLQAAGGAEHLVIGVDAGNEAWNFTRCTDTVLMGAMLDSFLKQCPCPIRSMTSAQDEGALNQFDGSPVTITDKHGSRMAFRHAVERSFTVSYWDGKTHAYTIDSEMPGVGPHVSATQNPKEWYEPECMGAIALVALMTRQIPVVMSSPGVISDEPFENYDNCLLLAPRLAAMLPQDIQSWREFHGGEGRPFSPERILAVSGDNVRCDHVKATDGRIGCLVYVDAPCRLNLRAINNFDGEVWNPGTLERTPIQFVKGQLVPFDLRRARFLIGRWS